MDFIEGANTPPDIEAIVKVYAEKLFRENMISSTLMQIEYEVLPVDPPAKRWKHNKNGSTNTVSRY